MRAASPHEVLQFLGLKPGMRVLDLFGGNAYWAEIMAPVVGSKGHDTVWEPTQFYSDKTKASFGAFQAEAFERVDHQPRRSKRPTCRRIMRTS